MAFVPAWTSDIVGLQSPFEIIAVQDYGVRDGCDRYIVVIGRPLWASANPGTLWSMYFFCYYSVTASIELTSSVELPGTGDFRFSQTYGESMSGSEHTELLLNEIFLPPLDSDNNLGTLVLVYWEENTAVRDQQGNTPESASVRAQLAKTNTILELYVDTFATVHTTVLMRSNMVTSDETCGYLSFSIKTMCNLPDNSFVYVDDRQGRRPYIKKIAILPKQQPAADEFGQHGVVYTIIGVLTLHIDNYASSSQDIASDTTGQCEAQVEFVIARTHKNGVLAHRCDITPWVRDNPQHISVYQLLLREISNDKQILLTTSANDVMLVSTLNENSPQTVKRLVASRLSGDGDPVVFTIHNEYNIELQAEFVRHSRFRQSVYSWHSTYIPPTFLGTILRVNTEIQDETAGSVGVHELVMFTMMQSNLRFTSESNNFIREYAVTLQDTAAVQAYYNVSAGTGGLVQFKMAVGSGITQILQVKIEEKCDYMNCKGCRSRSLKSACQAAQTCATVNCVGTVINPNNILCVMGSLMKETSELYTSNADAAWFAVVELTMSVMRLAKVTGQKDVVYVESISNFIQNGFCETKDILAIFSAVMPSLIFSIYVAASGDSNNEASNFDIKYPMQSKIKEIFSPGVQLKNAALVSSITTVLYQIALIALHIISANSKLVLCGVDKLAEFSGGYIDVVDHDVDREGIDFCSSGSNIPDSIAPRSDRQIILDRIAIGAVDDSTVDIRIGRQSISPGSFVLDRARAIVWVRNYRYVTMFIWINAAFDSVLGILYGLSRLLSVFEEDNCKPKPVRFSSVLNCVCGDSPFIVHPKRRAQDRSDGALWCTGLLKMINSNGDIVYVDNNFPLQELAADLHLAGQSYIDCIATKNTAQCTEEHKLVYPSKYAKISRQNVSPLAVLTRCRENYNSKTWDEGIYGVYNPALRDAIVENFQVSRSDLDSMASEIDKFIAEDSKSSSVHACLIAGPNQGRIQACMNLAFSHLNKLQLDAVPPRPPPLRPSVLLQVLFLIFALLYSHGTGTDNAVPQQTQMLLDPSIIPDDFSVGAYFVYSETTSSSALALTPDACEFLSSELFDGNPEVAKCANTNSPDVCGAAGSDGSGTCRIAQSTFSYEQSIQTNIIDEFETTGITIMTPQQREQAIADVDAQVVLKYSEIKTCTGEAPRRAPLRPFSGFPFCLLFVVFCYCTSFLRQYIYVCVRDCMMHPMTRLDPFGIFCLSFVCCILLLHEFLKAIYLCVRA